MGYPLLMTQAFRMLGGVELTSDNFLADPLKERGSNTLRMAPCVRYGRKATPFTPTLHAAPH
jgi:hypothetical protein